MSVKRKNIDIANIDIEAVLDRFKELSGFDSDAEVAKHFGLGQSDFSIRKKRGTLLPFIVKYSIDNDIDMNYIFAGIILAFRGSDSSIPDPVLDLLDRAKRVLMSGNGLAADALSKNILYFSHAVEVEGQIVEMKRELSSLRSLVNDLLTLQEGKEEEEGGSERDEVI